MKPILKEKGEEFENYNRFEVQEYAETNNKCILWNEINLLYLASEGKIQVMDPNTNECVASKDVTFLIRSLTVTRAWLWLPNT